MAFESLLVDAAAAGLVPDPGSIDVIVGSNLYGDISSDITAALAGGLRMAPSANLHLNGRLPSMFEPVQGSALDIVGQGIANPVGPVLSVAMILDEVGAGANAERIRSAVLATCAAGICTPDVGGEATSAAVTDAVIANLSG